MGVFSPSALLLLCLGTLLAPSQGSQKYVEVSNPDQNPEVITVALEVLKIKQSQLIGCQLQLIEVKKAWLKTELGEKYWKIMMKYEESWRTGQILTVRGRFDVKQKPGPHFEITQQQSVISGHNVPVGGYPPAATHGQAVQDVVKATFSKLHLNPENHGCSLVPKKTEAVLSKRDTVAGTIFWKFRVLFGKTCPSLPEYSVLSTFLVWEFPPKHCQQPSGVPNVCIGDDIRHYINSAEMVNTGPGSPAIGAPGGYLRIKNPNQDQGLIVLIDDALRMIFGNSVIAPNGIADAAWKYEGRGITSRKLFALSIYVTLGGQHSLPNRVLLYLNVEQKRCVSSKKGCLTILGFHAAFEHLLKAAI